MGAAGLERFKDVLGGELAGQHRVVAAFYARDVHETRRAADQRAAGEGEFRDRLEAALRDGARAIGEPLAALQRRAHRGVLLEALELLEGREVGVFVVQMNHEADRHQVVAVMVEERAAAGPVVERPTEGMLHEAGLVLLGRDAPQLLEAEAVFLRLAALMQREFLDQRPGELAAGALSEDGVLAAQLHAAGEVRPGRSVAV